MRKRTQKRAKRALLTLGLGVAFVPLLGAGRARAADVPTAPPVAPTRPHRAGFTLELGVGGALTLVNDDLADTSFSSTGAFVERRYTRTRPFGGIAPLSLGIGGFVSENVALLFRASGTSYFKDGVDDVRVNAFYGPAIQFWSSDRWVWGAGLGLGAHGQSPLGGGGGLDLGVAAELRAGYAFYAGRTQCLRAGAALVPGVFDGTRTLGVALTLDWQLL
jgi:hypothetical protein